jgi:hypothetical protein
MKANLKGLGGIKHLFIAHGEKLGIAIVAVCAVMMIYSALGRDKLPAENGAGPLNEKITLAKQSIGGFTWDKVKVEFPGSIRQYKPLEQNGDSTVDPTFYRTDHWNIPWDSDVVPPIVLRTDPVLLATQGVEANGGSGLLAFVDPEVRRQKMLAEQTKARLLDAQQKKDQEKQQQAGEQGGVGGRGGRGGGREDDPYGGTGVIDPEHPKRRLVVGLSRPSGVPLQDYEEVRVAHWAVVVAKVPIKEQLKLYRDAFENARGYNPMADIPQYLGYFVERAEILASDEGQELKWAPVYAYNGKGERISKTTAVTLADLYGTQDPTGTSTEPPQSVTKNWVMQMPEIVDPRYLEGGVLAFPLPPLVGRDWGSEVTHSEVPLAEDAVPEEEETKPKAKKPAGAAEESADIFAGGGAAGGALGGRQSMVGGGREGIMGGMGGRGGYGMGEGGGRGGYGGGRGGYGGGEYGGRGMGGGYGMEEGGGRGGYAGGGGGGGLGPDGEPRAPHWLLRFFDFSVQPGKKYKYRVRLAMLDPNQSFGGRHVDADSRDTAANNRVRKERKPGKTPFRLTEWSQPSRTVTIPLAGSVSVASAKPATDQFNSEPEAKLLVESFGTDDKGNAIQAAKEKDLHRGSVANMTEDTEVLADQGRAIDPFKAFKFQTDITVADIRGGERLTRKDVRPARVLLMGPAGQLFVKDEIGDAEVVATHRATFAKEPPGGAGGYMGEGGYGGRGEAGAYGGRGGGGGGRGGR